MPDRVVHLLRDQSSTSVALLQFITHERKILCSIIAEDGLPACSKASNAAQQLPPRPFFRDLPVDHNPAASMLARE